MRETQLCMHLGGRGHDKQERAGVPLLTQVLGTSGCEPEGPGPRTSAPRRRGPHRAVHLPLVALCPVEGGTSEVAFSAQ